LKLTSISGSRKAERVGTIIKFMEMATTKRDIIIPKEMQDVFKNSIRIIDKKHLAGFWPVDLMHLKQLQKMIPELFRDEAIMKKYDIAVTYTGNNMKADLSSIGIESINDRLIKNIFIYGIPVPWQLLKKAGVDYKKINIVLTPKVNQF
jgi:hypothetical protein